MYIPSRKNISALRNINKLIICYKLFVVSKKTTKVWGNSGHPQTSDSFTYFVLVLNKEQHYNYNSSTVTSYTHMLENEHDTMSIQYIIYSQIRDSH